MPTFDVIVLGSGYPRGKGDAWTFDVDEPAKQNGWADIRFFPNMIVAQGAGVAGTSWTVRSFPGPSGAIHHGRSARWQSAAPSRSSDAEIAASAGVRR